MMRQDRFTEGAQEVLAESQQLVRTERHSQWDVEHVLLALLQHERGIMPGLMEKLGADRNALREAVARAPSTTPKLQYDVVQIYTTPRIVYFCPTSYWSFGVFESALATASLKALRSAPSFSISPGIIPRSCCSSARRTCSTSHCECRSVRTSCWLSASTSCAPSVNLSCLIMFVLPLRSCHSEQRPRSCHYNRTSAKESGGWVWRERPFCQLGISHDCSLLVVPHRVPPV